MDNGCVFASLSYLFTDELGGHSFACVTGAVRFKAV